MDERDLCPSCGMDGEIYYKGNYWCADHLMEEIYSFAAGVNFILAEDREADFDYFGRYGYKGMLQEILKYDYQDQNSEQVEEYIAANIDDFAAWMEYNRRKIVPLETIHNNLFKGDQNEQTIGNSERA